MVLLESLPPQIRAILRAYAKILLPIQPDGFPTCLCVVAAAEMYRRGRECHSAFDNVQLVFGSLRRSPLHESTSAAFTSRRCEDWRGRGATR